MLHASLDALELNEVTFPDSFVPAYYFKDAHDVWYVCELEPELKNGDWDILGDWYEIGVDPTEHEEYTPLICRKIPYQDSLFKITSIEEEVFA